MKITTKLAALLVCLAAALVPALASGDAGTTVQGDLTQLGNDITAAHTALLADASTLITAAQGGGKAAVKAALATLHADASKLLPAVQADRKQLSTDLQAARTAHITGLGATVKEALETDRAAIRELREAFQQARAAVRAFRQASLPAKP